MASLANGGIPLRDMDHGRASHPVIERMEEEAPRRPGLSLTVGGLRHSILTLTATAIGGGVLSVSYVMRLSGAFLGLAMLVAGAALAYESTVILMQLSTETGHRSYAGLFAHCAGPRAAPVLDAMLFVYGNGASVGYFVFLGDFLPPILTAVRAPHWMADRAVVIIASALAVAPMAVQKDLSMMRFVAPVSIMALIYVTVVVAIRMPALHSMHAGDPEFGPTRACVLDLHICEAFAVCVFAYNCHINVVPVADALVRPTRVRIQRVGKRVNALQLLFYGLMGISGYLSFLAATPQDILNGYDNSSPFITVGRGLLSCTMLVAIPMNLHPGVRSGLRLLRFCREGPEATDAPAPSPPESPPMGPAGSPGSESFSSAGVESFVGSSSLAEPGGTLRVLLAAGCVACQALVAVAVPGVADVLGLLGATVATAMMLLIPAYCMRTCMPLTAGNSVRLAAFMFFSLLSAASVPIKVFRMLGMDI